MSKMGERFYGLMQDEFTGSDHEIITYGNDSNVSSISCYEGCSKNNPHLARACLSLGDYSDDCPTNKRLNGGCEK